MRKSHRRACARIWQESLGSSYDVDRTAQPACDSLNTLPRNEISPQTHRERASEFLLRIKARFEPSIYTQLVTILSTLSHATQQSSIIEVRDTHKKFTRPHGRLHICRRACTPARPHACTHARTLAGTNPHVRACNIQVRNKVSALFCNHEEVLEDFQQFLPDALQRGQREVHSAHT